jgi:hypothetical protein
MAGSAQAVRSYVEAAPCAMPGTPVPCQRCPVSPGDSERTPGSGSAIICRARLEMGMSIRAFASFDPALAGRPTDITQGLGVMGGAVGDVLNDLEPSCRRGTTGRRRELAPGST